MKVELSVDKEFNRVYTATYQVIASKFHGPLSVSSAPGLPLWGSSFVWGGDFDLWCFVNGIKATPIERIQYDNHECWQWIVTVTWSTVPVTRGPSQERGNPLLEPPVISGSFVGSSLPAYRDIEDKPIANTAGEPYNPPPMVKDGIDTLRIGYNTAVIDLVLRAEAIGKVNELPIWGLESRQAFLNQWTWNIAYSGTLAFIRNEFEFHINRKPTPTSSSVCTGASFADKEGWYTVLPNEGLAPLEEPEGERIHKKDKQDMPLTSPVPLTCDGTEGEDDKFNIFAVEREFDFLTIPGLPDPLPGPFV